MRRDRKRSAICLGTSADLIKLILAPWTPVTGLSGSSGAGTAKGEETSALFLVYSCGRARPSWALRRRGGRCGRLLFPHHGRRRIPRGPTHLGHGLPIL